MKKEFNVNGLVVTVDIPDNGFINRDILDRRDAYIKRVHKSLRSYSNILFAMYAADNIISCYPKEGAMKAMFALEYIDRFEYVEKLEVERYMINVRRFGHMTDKNWGYLEREEYVEKLMDYPNPVLYAITTKGKNRYKTTCKVFTNEVVDYLLGNVPEKIGIPRVRIAMTNPEFKRVEKPSNKREIYRAMMLPFWEAGMKRIPKNLVIRHEVVYNFIMKRKEAGEEIEPIYFKYLERWQPSDVYQALNDEREKKKRKRKLNKNPKGITPFGAKVREVPDTALELNQPNENAGN